MPNGGNGAALGRGTGNVSRRMPRNLRLHVGMVRTFVKPEMGEKFPGKVGLKHEEPLGRNIVEFWDRMLASTSRDRNK